MNIQQPDLVTRNLVALLWSMSSQLRRVKPDSVWPQRAIDYVNRAGLTPSPLRAEAAPEVAADHLPDAEIAALRGLLREFTQLQSEVNDHTPESFRRGILGLATRAHKLLAAPQHVSSLPSTPQPDKPNADAEQAAFEHWLHEKCPSGDCESVHRQWLESGEYADLLDQQSSKPAAQPAVVDPTASYEAFEAWASSVNLEPVGFTLGRMIWQAAQRAKAATWDEPAIKALAVSMSAEVARNASTAPQLCFPYIYLGLKEALLPLGTAGLARGYCSDEAHCVCGGDTQGVREGCSRWVKRPGVSKLPPAATKGAPV